MKIFARIAEILSKKKRITASVFGALGVIVAAQFLLYPTNLSKNQMLFVHDQTASGKVEKKDNLLKEIPDNQSKVSLKAGREIASKDVAAKEKTNGDTTSAKELKTEVVEGTKRTSASVPAFDPASITTTCEAKEYPGHGSEAIEVDAKDWKAFMDLYHGSKARLLSWLSTKESQVENHDFETIRTRIADARVVRPGDHIDPDLAWRGILVRSTTDEGASVIHVSSGFFTLMKSEPARAQFEVIRVLAQGISPCEVSRSVASADHGLMKASGHSSEKLFGHYLKCQGIDSANECEHSTISESGWAVSTGIAYRLAEMKCAPPAFKETKDQDCLKFLR